MDVLVVGEAGTGGGAVMSSWVTRAVLDRSAARLPAGGVARDRPERLTDREREALLAYELGLV